MVQREVLWEVGCWQWLYVVNRLAWGVRVRATLAVEWQLAAAV